MAHFGYLPMTNKGSKPRKKHKCGVCGKMKANRIGYWNKELGTVCYDCQEELESESDQGEE